MKQLKSRVAFKCNDLSIEGILHSLDVTEPAPGIVVCHPHPLYGGSMSNKVVLSVCEQANERGLIALRFNFRGVGASQGHYDDGKGEADDASAAVSFLAALPNVDPRRLGIVGYSFGGYVALRAATTDERIADVAAISPQISPYDLSFFHNYANPKLLVSGALDDVVTPGEFTAFAEQVSEPKVLEVHPSADHFWIGLEHWLGTRVADFFVRNFS